MSTTENVLQTTPPASASDPPAQKPRLLLIHAPLGGGHGAAARAIARAAESDGVEALVVNAYDHCTGIFGKIHVWLYFVIASHIPGFYNWMFNSLQGTHDSFGQTLRRLWDRLLGRPLVRIVREVKPTAIICTHYYPLVVLAAERRRGRLDVPVYVVIPDYGVHDIWVEDGTDGYLVAGESARRGLLRRGVSSERIHMVGIPVDSAFGEGRMHWPTARRTVLLLSGGQGVGPIPRLLRSLSMVPEVRVVVVCGRNAALKRRVDRIVRERQMQVEVLGYTTEVPRLMREADLVITKPGGLSTAEAFACGRPILFSSSGGGQETINLEEAVASGGALAIGDIDDAGALVRDLLTDSKASTLMRLRNAALVAGRPGAARAVVRRVVPLAARLRVAA